MCRGVRGDGLPQTCISQGCWLDDYLLVVPCRIVDLTYICVYLGEGALSRSCWEIAASSPTCDGRGEGGGALGEDEERGGKRSGAKEVFGLTAEDSARQSVAGLCKTAQRHSKNVFKN